MILKCTSQGHKLLYRLQFQNRRKSNVSKTLIKFKIKKFLLRTTLRKVDLEVGVCRNQKK